MWLVDFPLSSYAWEYMKEAGKAKGRSIVITGIFFDHYTIIKSILDNHNMKITIIEPITFLRQGWQFETSQNLTQGIQEVRRVNQILPD